MMRFDRFTERAQEAAMRAYEILQRYGHSQVDTEHLLLALIEQPLEQVLLHVPVAQASRRSNSAMARRSR